MKNSVLKLSLVTLASVLVLSCSKDDDSMNTSDEKYATQVAMTDAPIDNANVSAAVVTVTGVKVNGTTIDGFTATTIDLLTLQNGVTELLGEIDLEAQQDATVSLILDYQSDISGNFPGCYVETTDGVKHALEAGSNEIKISDKVDILASTANKIIIDFDLRKTIIAAADTSDQYEFATESELQAGLRLVNDMEAGAVSGTITDTTDTSEQIVAYAYEKGTYSSAEAEGQGASSITFANAVTSAKVNQTTGTFELNFLKEGDYEVHFASYSDSNADGKFELNGMLEVESATGLNLGLLEVNSKLNLKLSLLVKGLTQ